MYSGLQYKFGFGMKKWRIEWIDEQISGQMDRCMTYVCMHV